jgi:ribose transport system substrate-binding protein
MKRMFALLSFLVILSMLVACTPVKKSEQFVMISPNRQHPVVHTIMLGFWEACTALKVECKDYSFDGVDFSLMAPAVDQVIAAGASGAIAFVETAVYEQDKKLGAAGIPFIMIHGKLPEGEMPGLIGWVAADATDYAIRTADFMGERMGGTGVVAITQGSLNDVENVVSQEFTKEMALKFPGITVLAPEMEGFDVTQAIAKAVAILAANPSITAVFGTTGGSPTTWAKALEQSGKAPGDIIVVGMDYTKENLDLVKAKWVTALVGQPLYEEAYRAVEILVANSRGEKIDYDNVLPAPIITFDDIDTYYGYANRVDALYKTP